MTFGLFRPKGKVLGQELSGVVVVIQLANHSGAIVTAVDSTEKLEFLSNVGAFKTIDYSKEDFTKNGETYDVIFDVISKSDFSRSFESLNEDGSYIIAVNRVLSQAAERRL